jgi:hypothetical protein
MRNLFCLKQGFYPLLFVFAIMISACTKIPGHLLEGTTTTVPKNATLTYQLGTNSAVTLNSPSYFISFAQASANGSAYVTLVSAFNLTTSDNIGLQFDATKAGTYTASLGYFEVGAVKLHTPPGVETMTVSTYDFKDDGQHLNGTIKGTFSGFMLDSLNNQVKLTGSFNITQ